MKTELSTSAVLNSEHILEHWKGHRSLTRRVIEAFREDKLFSHSIGGMRTFGEMSKELIDLAGRGMHRIVNGNWVAMPDLNHQSETATIAAVNIKLELLRLWDMVAGEINHLWPNVPEGRFSEIDIAFGLYEGEIRSVLFYFIDNEIHHRGEGDLCTCTRSASSLPISGNDDLLTVKRRQALRVRFFALSRPLPVYL